MKPKTATVLFSILVLIASLSSAYGTGSEKNIQTTLCALHGVIRSALAVGMLLLVVLAAIVYAVGQVMGAETRARASVWATAMFTGAIIGALIYILLPYLLDFLMYPDKVSNVCNPVPLAPGPEPIPLPPNPHMPPS